MLFEYIYYVSPHDNITLTLGDGIPSRSHHLIFNELYI